MTDKPKPCPFCGEKLITHTRGIIGVPIVFVKYSNPECGAIVSFDNNQCRILPESAITAWNRRA